MPGPTRRTFLSFAPLVVAAQSHVADRQFEELASKYAIFGLYSPGLIGLDPWLYSLRGAKREPMRLRDLTTVIAASAAGADLAWIPESSIPWPVGSRPRDSKDPLELLWAGDDGAIRSIQHEYFVQRLSIARSPTKLSVAMIASFPTQRRIRLILLDGGSGRLLTDFTSAIRPIEPRTLLELRLSDGIRQTILLVHKSRVEWIDIASGVTTTLNGTSPSISCAGDRIAYITDSGEAEVLDLTTSARSKPPGLQGFSGFGAWSPNDRFILATIGENEARPLVIVHLETGKRYPVTEADPWSASRYVFLSRHFLKETTRTPVN